jgi:hypothetical protein
MVQAVAYFATDLHAMSVAESHDSLVLLGEMQSMHAELWGSPQVKRGNHAPRAVAMWAQLDAQSTAGPLAHVGSVTMNTVFAVSRAQHNMDDDTSYRMAMRGCLASYQVLHAMQPRLACDASLQNQWLHTWQQSIVWLVMPRFESMAACMAAASPGTRASLPINSCTHGGSIAWHMVPRSVSLTAGNAAPYGTWCPVSKSIAAQMAAASLGS